jgi:ATP-binding cassette subfamily B protein
MSDYFETDEVVKEYDRRIFRRILGYLKPYRLLILLTLGALVFSTLGELLVPILQQWLIDESIVVKFFTLRKDAVEGEREAPEAGGLSPGAKKALAALLANPGALEIGNRIFIKQRGLGRMSAGAERELREKAFLEEGDWYAFGYGEGSETEALVKRRAALFVSGDKAGAILKADFDKLDQHERTLVKSADISGIIRTVLLLFFILLLTFAFTFVQTWSSSLIGQEVMRDLRLSLFKKTLSQSTAFLSRHPVGRIVTRLTGDVETINEFFTSVLVAFLKDLSVMAGVVITLFILSPKLALVVLAILPPVLGLTMVSRVKARDAFRRQRTASSRVNSYLSERLSGVQVVQFFRGEKKSAGEFGERNRELLRAKLGEMYVFAIFRPTVEWFAVLTTAAVIVAGANMVLSLSLSLGALIAFINLIGMFYSPVQDIAEKYTLLQSAMAGGERVFKLLDTEERIGDRGRRSPGTLRGHISFENVRFAYREGEEILKGLSFTVNPGETAAIVGYTGAGKTTIINALTRLWDIDSGRILLDGIPIEEIPLEELRRSCLPVLQDVFLFSGTMAENISLGLDLSDGEIEAAARTVHAHEFISRLPLGYKTVLAEGAANISSGQRQLISFARVIAHNPSIVILDEATSSIDTETEGLIQLGIRRVLAGRTSLVIAHRLSTIRNADRILVLSGGLLVEEGKHEELMAKNGLYAGLYRLQYERESAQFNH